MTLKATCPLLFLALSLPVHSSIVWVGGTSSDVFDESNWDLTSSSVALIDPNVSILDDLTIGAGPFANNPIIPDLGGQIRLQIGGGFSLTLDSVSLAAANNDGIGGDSAVPVIVNVLNGAALSPFFITTGVEVYVDGTSSITLLGGGDPINSQTQPTKINLVTGSTMTLASAAEFTEQGQDILVNGLVYDSDGNGPLPSNDALWDNTGTTRVATSVPEPAGLLLGVLGLGSLLRRRRA